MNAVPSHKTRSRESIKIVVDKPDRLGYIILMKQTQEANMKVENYRMIAGNGRHIRIATQVTFEDGYVIRFMDRMPKYLAVKQAIELRAKEGV